jgi:nitroreductase
MNFAIDDGALRQIFHGARTYHRWTDRPVTDEQIFQLYELLKWGPTSGNSSPARFVFVKSGQAKQKLMSCVTSANEEAVKQCPLVAIVGMDEAFWQYMPSLYPQNPGLGAVLRSPQILPNHLLRNSALQGGYLIMAARALGLDCGPMSGFDHARLDFAFFSGTAIRSNFICAIGYGNVQALRPRNPRLTFEQACRIE